MSDLADLTLSERIGWAADMMHPENEIWMPILAAARQRLRLTRQPCQTCGGSGAVPYTYSQTIATVVIGTTHDNGGIQCPACNGAGEVWPEALVEVVARQQYITATGEDDWEDEVEYQPEYAEMSRILARAVLDAVESWMEAGE